MFYLDPQTNKRYRVGTPFTYGDINYTAAGASHETFRSLGFVQVIVQPRPSDTYYVVSGPNNDGSWNATPRDLGQLKTSFVSAEVRKGQQALSGSDWLFVRDYESTTTGNEVLFEAQAVPAEVTGQRQAVRDTTLKNVTTIETAPDIDYLQKLMQAPAEVPDPNDPTKTIPNPEPHLDPLPEVDTEAAEVRSMFAKAKPQHLSPEQKLAKLGLTVADLKTLLGLKK